MRVPGTIAALDWGSKVSDLLGNASSLLNEMKPVEWYNNSFFETLALKSRVNCWETSASTWNSVTCMPWVHDTCMTKSWLSIDSEGRVRWLICQVMFIPLNLIGGSTIKLGKRRSSFLCHCRFPPALVVDLMVKMAVFVLGSRDGNRRAIERKKAGSLGGAEMDDHHLFTAIYAVAAGLETPSCTHWGRLRL